MQPSSQRPKLSGRASSAGWLAWASESLLVTAVILDSAWFLPRFLSELRCSFGNLVPQVLAHPSRLISPGQTAFALGKWVYQGTELSDRIPDRSNPTSGAGIRQRSFVGGRDVLSLVGRKCDTFSSPSPSPRACALEPRLCTSSQVHPAQSSAHASGILPRCTFKQCERLLSAWIRLTLQPHGAWSSRV